MADFDPDAYLRSKSQDFDPDAYLRARQKGTTDIPVGVRAPEPTPKRSILDRVGDAVGTIGQGASAVGSALRHPLDTLRDPSKRRELERGVDDMVTLGAGQRLAGWAGRKLGDSPEVDLQATEGQDAAGAPGYRTAGNLAGGLLPGAASAIGKAGGRLASKALGGVEAKGALAGAGMGAARGLLGYEAGAVPTAAAQAAIAGQSPLDAAREAATNPLGVGLAGTLGATGGAARGTAEHIRDPRQMSGRVLRDVEAAGGKVRPFGQPVHGGLFESPELTELKDGRAGVNELAGKSVGRIVQAQQERLAKAREAFGEAQDSIIAEHGDRHIPVTSSHAALDAVDRENTLNGVTGDERTAAVTGKLRQMLTTDTGQLDYQASQAAGEPVTVKAPAVKAKDLIGIRKFVNRQARQATEPTDRYVYGKILDALGDDASAADPRIAQMNQQFKGEMQQLSAGNDALFGQKRPELRLTEAATQSAVGKLGRVGDDTQAGTIGESRLDRAAAASPQTAQELRLMRAKKAQERLRYGGEGETSTSIEKGMAHGARHAAAPLLGAALGGAVGHAAGAIGGAALGGMVGNPLALKLRLGLPLADTAGKVTGSRAGFTFGQMSDLARQRREAEQQAAQRLLGAGAGGPLEPGNIDLNNRPIHHNPDGSISTVRSMSFQDEKGGPEILVPTIADDGTSLTDDQAIALYRRTGKHLGKFRTPDEATAYAQRLHEDQARMYLPRAGAQ